MITIAGKKIQPGSCFIIAEAGVNHNGKLDIALQLVDAAVKTGADALKFQTFITEELVTTTATTAAYQKEAGEGESQYAMLKKLELSFADFRTIKKYCDKKGILFLSTPHTEGTLDIVDELTPAFKIGSGDLTNTPFLERVAKRGKPTIVSTGMADLSDVKRAVEAFTKYNKQLIILLCTTSYPCPPDQVNLRAMDALQQFGFPVGFSDHTEGIAIPIMAASMGATVIEKHFTLDNHLEGPDHAASLEPAAFTAMVSAIRNKQKSFVPEALGSDEKNPTDAEKAIAAAARKSIVAKQDIATGTMIEESYLTIKRPGTGIPPYSLNAMIGKRAKHLIRKDTVLQWVDVE